MKKNEEAVKQKLKICYLLDDVDIHEKTIIDCRFIDEEKFVQTLNFAVKTKLFFSYSEAQEFLEESLFDVKRRLDQRSGNLQRSADPTFSLMRIEFLKKVLGVLESRLKLVQELILRDAGVGKDEAVANADMARMFFAMQQAAAAGQRS